MKTQREKTQKIDLKKLNSLLTKIGGEARLHELLEVFYQRMSQDLLIGFFFTDKNLKLIAQMQAAFLLRAMGARTTYEGKAPADAHDSLPPILKGHFDRRLLILRKTLSDFGLTPDEIEIWIQFEDAFRNQIVHDR